MPAFDYKKKYREYYLPGTSPSLIEIPPIQYAAVEGQGDPNEKNGSYQAALNILYAISYTIKMSDKGGHAIEGYFPYVVPPLEGLWQMAGGAPGVDYSNKAGFQWVSMIRLPEFVTLDIFRWAQEEAARKKKLDTSPARFFTLEEGLCVQCMHIGSYDEEPATLEKIERFLQQNGYQTDLSSSRRHHEIYLSDPRRTAPEKRKTVLRLPVKR